MLFSLTLFAALADEPARRTLPPEPRHLQDLSAYTVGVRRWRIGPAYLDYGLLDNVSVGTSPLGFLIGPNLRAKVEAAHLGRFELSLEGGWWSVSVLNDSGLKTTVAPLGWTLSCVLSPRVSVHGGNTWILGRATGKVDAETLGDALGQVVGTDVSEDLRRALGDQTYGDALANVALAQTQLASEYRFNRRGSLVLQLDTTLWLRGLVAAGVGTEVGDGGSASGGAAARLDLPLRDSLPTASSIAWHWSFERFNLRLGLPLAFRNPLSYVQALEFYWLLGPEPAGWQPSRPPRGRLGPGERGPLERLGQHDPSGAPPRRASLKGAG
jgi:hypothetical protein